MRETMNFSVRGISHLVGGQPKPSLRARRLGRLGPMTAALAFAAASLAAASSAIAQPRPPSKGTDMEIDPDAPPPEEPKKEEAPLPPPDPNAWGVGGKEEEGRFAPQGKTGSLKEDEEDKKEAEDDKGPVDLGPAGLATVEMVVGFGEMNEVLNDASTPTNATVFSFLFGVQYRAWDIWTMGLRLPYATGTFKGGGHDDYNTFALGNFEASLSPSFQISRRLRVPVGLAFALPAASGDVFANPAEDPGSIAQAVVNDGADAARGLEESELFAYGRFGLIPSVGVTYDRGALHAAAQTKLAMMFRTGGEDPNVTISSTHKLAEIHDPAVNWVTRASASYDVLDGRISPGLRLWLAVSGEPVTKGTRDLSGAQFALEPMVNAKFPVTDTMAVRGGLSFIIPAGGPVGGQLFGASMTGMRLHVGLLFGGSAPQPEGAKPAPPSLLDAPPEEGTTPEGSTTGEGSSTPEGSSAPEGSVEQDPKADR